MGVSARCDSGLGVPWSHPHFVLEFSLISVVFVCWGNERKKEKIQRKRWDLRENEGKKEKKNVVKLKEKKHYHWRPTLSSLTLSSVVVIAVSSWKEDKISETKFYLLSLCGYMVKKEPHHTTFFSFFRKGYTVNNFWTMDLWLLATNNYLSMRLALMKVANLFYYLTYFCYYLWVPLYYFN